MFKHNSLEVEGLTFNLIRSDNGADAHILLPSGKVVELSHDDVIDLAEFFGDAVDEVLANYAGDDDGEAVDDYEADEDEAAEMLDYAFAEDDGA